MISIANLNLIVSDGSTIASTEIYEGKQTYINIGSGNIFKLRWTVPTFDIASDKVDHYDLVIKRHDVVTNSYYDIFNKNIGLPFDTNIYDEFKNEFYVDSYILPVAPLQYKLSIYIVAYGKKGSVVTSNIVTPYISKGAGTYVKVKSNDYREAIMKRTIAFVNAPTTTTSTIINPILVDHNKVPLAAKTVEGAAQYLAAQKMTKILTNDSWNIVQDSYIKNSNGWQANDIKYETLLVENNGLYEPVMDSKGELIYVL